MMFNILICLAFLLVVFIHYVQGFFSAFISAVLAIIAASLAVSYHEPIVAKVFQGKMADSAFALSLIALFAIIYTVLRVIFDKMVPGGLQLPAALDKIGGGLMGVVAALFCVGLIAVAAQTLPWGATTGGYAKYEMKDEREVSVGQGGGSRSQDMTVGEELKADKFDPQDKKSLWIPVDDVLMGFVSKLSDGGSLAGDQKLAAVHPNYTEEMWASRLGIQPGANFSAVNLGTRNDVELKAIYKVDEITQKEGEIGAIRKRTLEPVRKAKPGEVLVAFRILFSRGATDKDGIVRFSPGSIRVCAAEKDYYPIGTIDPAPTPVLYAAKPDDFLFVNVGNEQAGADVLFALDSDAVPGVTPKGAPKTLKFAEGAFLEVKRLARIELTDKLGKIDPAPPKTAEKVAIIRKTEVSGAKPGGGSGDSSEEGDGPPLLVKDAQVVTAPKLFTPLNAGTKDKTGDASIDFGNMKLQDRKISAMELDGSRAVALISKGPGEQLVSEVYVPPGKKMVLMTATLNPKGDPWRFTNDLGAYRLVDEADQSYQPAGAWIKAKKSGQDFLVAKYHFEDPPGEVPKLEGGTPAEAWVAFLIPTAAKPKVINYNDKPVKTFGAAGGKAAPKGAPKAEPAPPAE